MIWAGMIHSHANIRSNMKYSTNWQAESKLAQQEHKTDLQKIIDALGDAYNTPGTDVDAMCRSIKRLKYQAAREPFDEELTLDRVWKNWQREDKFEIGGVKGTAYIIDYYRPQQARFTIFADNEVSATHFFDTWMSSREKSGEVVYFKKYYVYKQYKSEGAVEQYSLSASPKFNSVPLYMVTMIYEDLLNKK